MKKDKIACPNCGNNYDVEFLEENIGRLVKCTFCTYPAKVAIRRRGWISVCRQNRGAKAFVKKNIITPPLERMLDSRVEFQIKFVKGEFHDQHKQDFFKQGKLKWVREARSKVIFEAKVFGMDNGTIKKYFQKNGGQVYKETINHYLNN